MEKIYCNVKHLFNELPHNGFTNLMSLIIYYYIIIIMAEVTLNINNLKYKLTKPFCSMLVKLNF